MNTRAVATGAAAGAAIIAAGAAVGAGYAYATTPACPASPTLSQALLCNRSLNTHLGLLEGYGIGLVGVLLAGFVTAAVSDKHRSVALGAAGTAAAIMTTSLIVKAAR